jgi:3-oxoacyl-[acyl-carrier protein] reductase
MKAALVTGASSGIGRATALQLAARGYAVALLARNPANLQAAAREVKTAGARALPIAADVSRPADVATAVRQALDAFSRLDLLVNNAGHAPRAPTAAISPDQWQAILDTNLSSVFYATRAVWPTMTAQGGGAIVNVSSMSSIDPFMGLGAYGAAKAGVNLLTLATAREGAPAGIRVYGVAPGAVDTPMLRGVLGDTPLDPALVLQPHDIASVIVAMAEGSPDYVPGQTLCLRAGHTPRAV